MHLRPSMISVIALATLIAPAFADPASAGGGSWLEPERPAYASRPGSRPGQIATFYAVFYNGSLEGRIADGPYVAYLLPEGRWMHHPVVPASAIRLGELAIARTSRHSFRARVEFRVPEVPSGMYHVAYCNDPCTVNGIGDLIAGGSTPIAIGATPIEARVILAVHRVRSRQQVVAERARQRALAEQARLEDALAVRTLKLHWAEGRANVLREDLSRARHALATVRSGTSWAGVAVGLAIVCLALAAVIVIMRRRLRDVRFDAAVRGLVEDEPVDAGTT